MRCMWHDCPRCERPTRHLMLMTKDWRCETCGKALTADEWNEEVFGIHVNHTPFPGDFPKTPPASVPFIEDRWDVI